MGWAMLYPRVAQTNEPWVEPEVAMTRLQMDATMATPVNTAVLLINHYRPENEILAFLHHKRRTGRCNACAS